MCQEVLLAFTPSQSQTHKLLSHLYPLYLTRGVLQNFSIYLPLITLEKVEKI